MPAAPADIKVQRGIATFGAASDFVDVSFPEAVSSTSRAFVRITNALNASNGRDIDSTTTYLNRDLTANVTSISTTSFRLDRFSTAVDEDFEFYWEVIEYIGESGGPNEFIVRGLVEELHADGTNSSSVDLSSVGIANSADCVPFNAGYRNNSNLSQWSRVHTTATFSGVNPDLDLVRGSSNGANRSSWFIVEFTGSNWSVEHATQNWMFSNIQLVTLATTYDWDSTFVYSLFRPPAGENGLDEIGWLAYRRLSDGNDEFTIALDPNADDIVGGNYITENYVISNPEMVVDRTNSIRTSNPFLATDNTKILTVLPGSDTARMSALCYTTCEGGGTIYPRPMWGYRVTDVDELTFRRSYIGQAGEWARNIIYWPDFLGPFEIAAEADLPGLGSASGTLTQVFEVVGTATLPGLEAEAVLTQVFAIAGTATLPGLGSSSGTLTQVFAVVAVAELDGLGSAQGTLTQVFVVVAIAELPGLGASGTETQIFILAGTSTLPRIGAVGSLFTGLSRLICGPDLLASSRRRADLTASRDQQADLTASQDREAELTAGRAIAVNLLASYDGEANLLGSCD